MSDDRVIPFEAIERASAARLAAAVPRSPSERLRGLLDAYREHFHVEDERVLLGVLAAYAANRLPGDPVWLMVLGASSSGKTEALGVLSGLPHVVAVSKISGEAAFLSGTSKREKKENASGGLLKQIGPFGLLALKDFTSILSMPRDSRFGVLAALREIYDGSFARVVGSDGGQTLSWSGKVGLIAACTEALETHHAVTSSMGERFITLRVPPADASALVARTMANSGHEVGIRYKLADAAKALFDGLRLDALDAPAPEELDRLTALAAFTARARSPIERDGYQREVVFVPAAEEPPRLAKALWKLREGALCIGASLEDADALLEKAAFDSVPRLRMTAFRAVLDAQGTPKTSEIAEATDTPTNTARRALEDLALHGLLVRHSQGEGRPDLWSISELGADLWSRAKRNMQ